MYGTYLTLAVLVLLAYVLWRASSVPALRRLPRSLFPLAGLLLALLVIIGRWLDHRAWGSGGAALDFASWTLSGSIFLSFACLFPVDLLTGFGLFCRGRAARLRGWALLAGCLLSLLALFQGMRPPAVSRHEVELPGLGRELDGTRLAVISDLHLGKLLGPGWLAARVAQVRALKPDMILFLGDLFEGHGEPAAAFLPELEKLSALLGIWAVDGNHEMNGHRARRAGGGDLLPTLRDCAVEPAPGLFVAGRRSILSHGRETRSPWSPDARRSGGAWILMSHVPSGAEAAARAGVGLMLAGHTHGGQLWPLSLLTRRVFPLTAGRYRVGGMTVLVSRGTGNWGPRMRLWRRAEIMLVVLKRARVTSDK